MQLALDLPIPKHTKRIDDDDNFVGVSDAPFGLSPILWHIGTFLKWPFSFLLVKQETTVPLKNGEFVTFVRATPMNIFVVEYRFRNWIIGSNGYAEPGLGRLTCDRRVGPGDGRVAHTFLRQFFQ